MINWETLCSPRGSGGLGIHRLRDFNVSSIQMVVEASVKHPFPWVTVVLHNYYRRGRPLDLHDKLAGHVSHFWRGVLKTTNAFKIELRICCGQGTFVKF